jgi:tRNA threonylcarbamoyladenosine biosynthesis protein TsaE
VKRSVHRTASVEATRRLGEQVGRRLRGGEVIELVSDLGGGKTQFVHGLAAGIGSRDAVQSPSFTISRVYRADHEPQRSDLPESRSRAGRSADQQASAVRELWHFDFYRLTDPGLIRHELAEAIGAEGVAVAIEWAEPVADILPDDRLTVTIRPTGETTRSIELTAAGPRHAHLLD